MFLHIITFQISNSTHLQSVSFTLLFILLTMVGWLVFLGGFIAFSVENG